MLMRAATDLGALRATEFARLDRTSCTYLDYAGAALYPESLVQRDARRLTTHVLGNPHSESVPSHASTTALEKARQLTLRLLDADPRHYDVIFTANATGALRLVAESFPFRASSRLVLTADNHNSVNGIRVRARQQGATVTYTGLSDDLRGVDPCASLTPALSPSLLAFPAQSNFSGVKHPLSWVRAAHTQGYRVLVDAAAYLPTSRLSLTDVPADFVALSFYKIFGYPTGVGALVLRHDAMRVLRRDYFGGGTVEFASVQHGVARLREGAHGFEDGTPSFLAMPAVCDGLRWFERIGVERIGEHVHDLTASLLARLQSLGGRVRVYGPHDMTARGGIVAFNVVRANRVLAYEVVERAARDRGIAVRGGCFCNPGAAERALQLDAGRTRACLEGRFSIARLRRCLGDTAVGALRASVGLATTPEDLDRLVSFIEDIS